MTVVPRAWTLFLAQMLGVSLENHLPHKWVEEVRQKVSHEETPHNMWDHDDKIEVQLLSHPELAAKMYNYVDKLIHTCDEKYLPNIKGP
jgi:hypothetical protein